MSATIRQAADQVGEMLPALAFLCVGVPLAALLDELGFFDAVASLMQRRAGAVRVSSLWVLACVTTAVLNLDTTVVLLTPLYIRLARHGEVDPFPLAVIPLLTASLGSSFLPVSNLTTLIAADRLGFGTADVLENLAVPGLVACAVGWAVFRRQAPMLVPAGRTSTVDRRAMSIGSAVVAGLLVGFVVGGPLGLEPWVVVLVADVILMVVVRRVPWREVPIPVALGVAAIGFVAAFVVPSTATDGLASVEHPAVTAVVVGVAAGLANVINNLPALLVGLEGADQTSTGFWAWLLGVNTGAALVPIGALANLLWWRIAVAEGVRLDLRRYLRVTVPVTLAALAASAATLALLQR